MRSVIGPNSQFEYQSCLTIDVATGADRSREQQFKFHSNPFLLRHNQIIQFYKCIHTYIHIWSSLLRLSLTLYLTFSANDNFHFSNKTNCENSALPDWGGLFLVFRPFCQNTRMDLGARGNRIYNYHCDASTVVIGKILLLSHWLFNKCRK